MTSRTRWPPATCCPGRRRRSWRSTARGGSRGRPGALVGGLAFVVPGPRPHPRTGSPVPRRLATAVGRRRRRGRGRRGRGGRGPGRVEPDPGELAARGAGEPSPLDGLPRRRDRVRGDARPVARPRPAHLRRDRAWRAPRAGPTLSACAARGRGCSAAAACSSLAWVAFKVGALSYGGGLRDHPAHAGRRGQPLPLDDQRRVPQRRGARTDHARTRGPHRGRRRLRRRGDRRRTTGGGGRLLAVVRLHPARRASGSTRCAATGGRGPSSTAPGPAAIGAILGSAVALAGALTEPWQFAVLAASAVLLLGLRRGVVPTLLLAAAAGVAVVLAGGPVPG